MDYIAILDTETTGMDPSDSQCIEVGLVCYSLKCRAMVDCHSWLIHGESNPVEEINHIPTALINSPLAESSDHVWKQVLGYSEPCEYILTHNADFDRQWVPEWFPATPRWIDTCNAVTWPRPTNSRSLISLALAHGIGVVDPHRAINDCLLLAMLLTRVAELGYDVEAILRQGLRPQAMFRACVSYENNNDARKAGFRWEQERRIWKRKMAIEDAMKLPFEVAELEDG